jgi:hypothetical protein
MKTFLKTLIGGALGLGALYAVGKICYEAGKDMAEVERQLAEKTGSAKQDETQKADTDSDDSVSGGEQIAMDISEDEADASDPAENGVKLNPVKKYQISEEEFNDIWDRNTKYTWVGKMINRVKEKTHNLRMLVRAKQAFSGNGKAPGVLGALLRNPDGAHIEACIENGGVRINVRPRTVRAA